MRHAIGNGQRDVLDTVRTKGPCTRAAIAADTGRRDSWRIVESLIRRGYLVDYGAKVDVPCDPGPLRARLGLTRLTHRCVFKVLRRDDSPEPTTCDDSRPCTPFND